MSAIAIHAGLSAAAPGAVAVQVNPEAAHEAAFSALLGEMSRPKTGAAEPEAPAKGKPAQEDAAAKAADAPALSALQSLEAALNALPRTSPPTASAPAKGGAPAPEPASSAKSGTAASAALAAAAGAFGGGDLDVSGKTPLKAQLQADPAIGLSDFQMKTFLAASGATPAKAGGIALAADSAWSPLDASKLVEASTSAPDAPTNLNAPAPAALATTKATPSFGDMLARAQGADIPAAARAAPVVAQAAPAAARAAPAVVQAAPAVVQAAPVPLDAAPLPATPAAAEFSQASTPLTAAAAQVPAPAAVPGMKAATRASGAPRPASEPPSHGLPQTPVAGPAVAAAVSSNQENGAGTRRGSGYATPASADAATAAAAAAPTDSAGTPGVTVALANLPAFIADQANALSTNAANAQSPAAAPAETPKAAQAVKELKISLEPGDLGQMTLKLRLAGGKLSVTIAVANPQTLSSIEDDRALIAARLGAGDQTLEDLIIQRQAPSTSEIASPHGPANDSGSEPSTSDNSKGASLGERRPGAPPSGGARAGGAFSDLLV
jgi:hypothetical protein